MRYTYRILVVPKIMRISIKQAVDSIRSEIKTKVDFSFPMSKKTPHFVKKWLRKRRSNPPQNKDISWGHNVDSSFAHKY